MDFQNSSNICMSNQVRLAASVFEISCRKRTDRQKTNAGENPTPATAVCVGNKCVRQNLQYPSKKTASFRIKKKQQSGTLVGPTARRITNERCTSIAFPLDHGVMRHFHASVGAAAALQRSRHAVAELEVGVGDVCAERQFEVRVGDRSIAEPSDHVEISAARRRRDPPSGRNTARPGHLKQQLTFTAFSGFLTRDACTPRMHEPLSLEHP